MDDAIAPSILLRPLKAGRHRNHYRPVGEAAHGQRLRVALDASLQAMVDEAREVSGTTRQSGCGAPVAPAVPQ